MDINSSQTSCQSYARWALPWNNGQQNIRKFLQFTFSGVTFKPGWLLTPGVETTEVTDQIYLAPTDSSAALSIGVTTLQDDSHMSKAEMEAADFESELNELPSVNQQGLPISDACTNFVRGIAKSR